MKPIVRAFNASAASETSPMRFEVMRRTGRSSSSANPVSASNTPALAKAEFFIVDQAHSEDKKRAQPRAAPHFVSIYRIPSRTPQMGHDSQLSFSRRILHLREITHPSALDTPVRPEISKLLTSKLGRLDYHSREAAPDCSPGRKPRDSGQPTRSPVGAKDAADGSHPRR